VTTEGAAAIDATSLADDGRLVCYRHPDRETYIRCGRCDRPICTRCAMQGPVGFRCKNCGTLANDPLTKMSATQIGLGFAVAAGGGAVLGLISGSFGLFSILIAFFGGGIMAEAVTRVIGFKRGTRMLTLVLGGILVGMLAGVLLSYGYFFAQLGTVPVEDPELGIPEISMAAYIFANLPWLLLSAGAACFGAYSRLR
jgi:hypothetical protein